MNAKLMSLKKGFLVKQNILKKANEILKTEFFGIDDVIDNLTNSMSSWYALSDIQEKPLVINLWGLTGVGKTSLVSRLVELIKFNDRFFRFDLGVKQGDYSFSRQLSELCESNDISPVIIALDEFQHSKTVSGPFRVEIETDHNRKVWELIDSGKVQYIDWKYGLWDFETYMSKLNYLLGAGVKVEHGIVTYGQDMYNKEMHDKDVNDYQDDEEPLLFIDEDQYEIILELAGKELGIHLKKVLKETLCGFNGKNTIAFLKKVLKIAKRPVEKNFSKALIFVLGNLDEAYTMSSNFSAEIDADEFHEESLKITVPKIKKALKLRFRDEQIARLGNIHIIYPALNRKAYIQIIKSILTKISTNLKSLINVNISFDETVIDIIYKEGVYPTQGVRPVLTTIDHLIKSKLTDFLAEILINDLVSNDLKFSYSNHNLICNYYVGTKVVHKKSIEIVTSLEDMRASKKDDLQAITAVHESGHAILSAILLKTIPEIIYSVTSDSENNGFVLSKFAWKYVSRKELVPRVAMFLGGYAAEELIFGKENLTTGTASDIEKATSFLSIMYKDCGMGETPISYSIPTLMSNSNYNNYKTIEEEIKAVLKEALELAKQTLLKEKKLLLVMADYLSDNSKLKKEETEKLIESHASIQIKFITNGDLLFYRNHLKEKIIENNIEKPFHFFESISLNYDK